VRFWYSGVVVRDAPPAPKWRSVLALGLGLALAPGVAHAATMTDEAFSSILLLLSAVSAGYVLTHLAVERLSRRYVVSADVQYVLLGIVLGPVLGIIDTALSRDIRPVLSLGAGALGMLAGLELKPAADRRTGGWGPAIAIAICTTLMVVAVPLAILHLLGHDPASGDAWTGGVIAAGAVALSTTDGGVKAMAAFLGSRGSFAARAAAVARISKAIATVGFGLLFALIADDPDLQMRTPRAALEALGVQAAAGTALGLLFAASVYRKLDDRVLLTVLIGTIFLAAGIARSTHVSAIFVSFVAGAVFSVTSKRAAEVTGMLASIKRPFVIALFFFAGLEWVAGPAWTFVLVLPYLLLRWLGRRLGGAIGRRLTLPRQDYGPPLLPAGGLTIAFLLSLRLSFQGVPGLREAYGPLLVAVILTEFGALRAIRRWLIDVDDVPPELRDRRGGFDPEGAS
jgi:Kef-type K+ transport system membrane component KefB